MAERNGNGRKLDRWWVQTVISVGTILIVAGIAWATLKSNVEHNTKKNTEQDECIERTAENVHRLDKEQAVALASITEQLKAIRQDVGKLVDRSDAQ